jgi:hypothetical protein
MKLEVLKGLDTTGAVRALVDAGVLDTDPDGKATRVERLPELGNTRCYVVNPKLWGVAGEI